MASHATTVFVTHHYACHVSICNATVSCVIAERLSVKPRTLTPSYTHSRKSNYTNIQHDNTLYQHAHPTIRVQISAAALRRSSSAAPLPSTDLFSIARRLRYGITYRPTQDQYRQTRLHIPPASQDRRDEEQIPTSDRRPYGMYLMTKGDEERTRSTRWPVSAAVMPISSRRGQQLLHHARISHPNDQSSR